MFPKKQLFYDKGKLKSRLFSGRFLSFVLFWIAEKIGLQTNESKQNVGIESKFDAQNTCVVTK